MTRKAGRSAALKSAALTMTNLEGEKGILVAASFAYDCEVDRVHCGSQWMWVRLVPADRRSKTDSSAGGETCGY
jgi:hypothetical protein